MLATIASVYVAGRECQKKLSALEMELAVAKKNGFVSRYSTGTEVTHIMKRLLAVIGITTQFGRRKNRDAVRKAWMPSGAALERQENQKGVVAKFVIGRRFLFDEDDHVEAPEEHPKKTKMFLAHAVETWDAEFYVKVNDDVYVNIDGLSAILSSNLDKPFAYIGCMKSGAVFSEPRMLRTYAHDDISAGSWFIGLDVKHINEEKLCCSSWSSGKKQTQSEH